MDLSASKDFVMYGILNLNLNEQSCDIKSVLSLEKSVFQQYISTVSNPLKPKLSILGSPTFAVLIGRRWRELDQRFR